MSKVGGEEGFARCGVAEKTISAEVITIDVITRKTRALQLTVVIRSLSLLATIS